MQVLRSHLKAVIIAFLISTVGSATYFLNITYVPSYLETVAEYDASRSLLFGTVAAAAAIVVTPFCGLAADKWGRRGVLIGLLGLAVGGSTPAYLLINGATSTQTLVGVMLLAVPAAVGILLNYER